MRCESEREGGEKREGSKGEGKGRREREGNKEEVKGVREKLTALPCQYTVIYLPFLPNPVSHLPCYPSLTFSFPFLFPSIYFTLLLLLLFLPYSYLPSCLPTSLSYLSTLFNQLYCLF